MVAWLSCFFRVDTGGAGFRGRAGFWGSTQVHVDWPWLLSGLLPLYVLAGTLTDFDLTTLRVSRRQLNPRSYITRFKSITADGDEQIFDIQYEIRLMIKKGQFDIQKIQRWQKQALIALGIVKIKERD